MKDATVSFLCVIVIQHTQEILVGGEYIDYRINFEEKTETDN